MGLRGPGGGAHQVPLGGVALAVLGVDPVAVGGHVGVAHQQRDRGLLAVGPGPGDRLVAHRVVGAGGDQHDGRVVDHDGGAVLAHLETAGVALDDVLEGQALGRVGVGVLLAQVVARVGDGAAGVLLLHAAEEVGRVPDLGLDLLLAVAEVVVRDDGDDDAALVAGHALEGLAAVVELVLALPALAVTALALGGLLPGWQAQLLLGQGGQVRGEDDAAGVAGPRLRSQGGVVLRQVGVAAIAEDALDEVQVGDQAAGGDEADLHGALGGEAGDLGHDDGAQQQGHEAAGRLVLRGGPRQGQQVLGGLHGVGQQAGEDVARDGDLVIGDRQAALGDVEDAGGGAPVVAGVVQHAAEHLVALDVVGGEAGGVQRQRQGPCQAGMVQDEGRARQPRGGGSALQVGVQEGLDALVGSTGTVGQAAGELALTRQDGGHEAVRLALLDLCRGGDPQQLQTQGDSGSGGRVCSCHGTSLDSPDDTALLRSAQKTASETCSSSHLPAGRSRPPGGRFTTAAAGTARCPPGRR